METLSPRYDLSTIDCKPPWFLARNCPTRYSSRPGLRSSVSVTRLRGWYWNIQPYIERDGPGWGVGLGFPCGFRNRSPSIRRESAGGVRLTSTASCPQPRAPTLVFRFPFRDLRTRSRSSLEMQLYRASFPF